MSATSSTALAALRASACNPRRHSPRRQGTGCGIALAARWKTGYRVGHQIRGVFPDRDVTFANLYGRVRGRLHHNLDYRHRETGVSGIKTRRAGCEMRSVGSPVIARPRHAGGAKQ